MFCGQAGSLRQLLHVLLVDTLGRALVLQLVRQNHNVCRREQELMRLL